MSGTLIFVDIPNTTTSSKSQSFVALATSSSDPDLSKQICTFFFSFSFPLLRYTDFVLAMKDSRRNQTLLAAPGLAGRTNVVSVTTRPHKQTDTSTRQHGIALRKSVSSSHLQQRVQSTATSSDSKSPVISQADLEQHPTLLSRDSEPTGDVISESCDSSLVPSFPSFAFSSPSSPIDSYQPPEFISVVTDPFPSDTTSTPEDSFPQPASCASVSSSAYYSSYSSSHGRTVRVGHESLLHRSKSLFSLKG